MNAPATTGRPRSIPSRAVSPGPDHVVQHAGCRWVRHTLPVLIGRDDDIATLGRLLRDGASVVVTGEAGSGKSALLGQCLAGIARPVLIGQCFRSLGWTAGWPLQQALGQVIPAGDPAWTAQWIHQTQPRAVLRLDDLQWADPFTLAVVGQLPPSVVVAASVRSGDPGAEAAVSVLVDRGAQNLHIAALTSADGTRLAQSLHPHLRRGEAAALAERCGGNPLLIEELGRDAASAQLDRSLRRAVTGRLRRLGPDAMTDFALLVLADEPVPASWLPEVSTLTDAELVVVTDGRAQPRHPLLAEVVATELSDGAGSDRKRVLAILAERAERDGQWALAARAWSEIGGPEGRERARDLALRAVEYSTRPGERAALLHLAALSATGVQAAALAAQAVDELVVAGEYDRAATLIDASPQLDGARWWSLVGRVRWQQGEDDAAITAYERGLAQASTDSPEAVLLQVEHARAILLGRGDAVRGLELARAAHERAFVLGIEQARALAVLGTAEHFAAVPGDADHLAQAVALAEADGDLMVEFTSANNLVAVHESAGRGVQARALARHFATRAQTMRMTTWQQQMQAMSLNVDFHLGDYDSVLAEAPGMLAGVLDRRTRDQVTISLALVQIDLGRHRQAFELLETALAQSANDHQGRGYTQWVLSEAQLWSGDYAAAEESASAAIGSSPEDGRRLFPMMTLAHARAQLGHPLGLAQWPSAHVPLLTGAPLELAGLVAREAGDLTAAGGHFSAAALAWSGHHRRGELRCRWLAADAERDVAVAQRNLLALAGELVELGWTPLLGHVRRTLRRRGFHGAAARGRSGGLTTREREVLDLVAEGLSTDAIAARLALAPSTVAAQIASARARLGATTRWQAVGNN